MKNNVNRMLVIRYWLPVFLYAGLITFLSSLSSPGMNIPTMFDGYGDKIIHAIEYGIFGVLWYRGYRYASGSTMAVYATILAIISAVIFGMTDEFHQSFVPLRDADGWDVVADAIGAILGIKIWKKYVLQGRLIQVS